MTKAETNILISEYMNIIKRKALAMGLNAAEIARRGNVSPMVVSLFMNKNIGSTASFKAICDALEIPVESLFAGKGDKSGG